MAKLKVLMIGAHLDDNDFCGGGTALKYLQAGHSVRFLSMCNGNGGHHIHTPEEIAARLDRLGVCVRAGYHCAPLAHATVGTPRGGAVRVSPGITNRLRDVEEFLALLSHALPEEK